MKIQWKIFYCLFAIVTFLFVVVAVTYSATTKVSYYRDRSMAVEGRLLSATFLRAQVRNQLLDTFDVMYVSGIENSGNRLEIGKEEVQKRISELEKNLIESTFEDTTYKSDISKIADSYGDLQKSLDQSVILLKQGKAKEAKDLLIEAREVKFQNGFLKNISEIIGNERHVSEAESKNLEQSIQWLQRILLLSAGASLILAIILSTFISRSIGRRLAGIEKAAQKVSAGDFDIALDTNGSDEVSTLSLAFNKMAASLQEAKQQIVKQQELLVVSSKMSSLGEMASGIAHEINTPLAVISLKTVLLKEATKSVDFAKNGQKLVADTCEVIDRTAHRIAKIISGLRAFARDGASDPFQTVELQLVVQDTLDLCSERFRGSGVDLQVKMPSEPLLLNCRGTQISQVLLNLLSNSFDAVQELNEKWIRVEAIDHGQKVELSVTDSGRGIAPAVRAKLAQPFFTTKDVGKGTGLGLSISRGIVMDHGGQLILDEQNVNTRFVIILPKDPTKLA